MTLKSSSLDLSLKLLSLVSTEAPGASNDPHGGLLGFTVAKVSSKRKMEMKKDSKTVKKPRPFIDTYSRSNLIKILAHF